MLLILYIIAIFVTWCYAAWLTGIQFASIQRMHKKAGQPPAQIAVNYINIFFQGLCWPAYWMSLAGEWYEKRKPDDDSVGQKFIPRN